LLQSTKIDFMSCRCPVPFVGSTVSTGKQGERDMAGEASARGTCGAWPSPPAAGQHRADIEHSRLRGMLPRSLRAAIQIDLMELSADRPE